MYRIELAPGEETALRTIEELAIGIRNGVVTPRARIWHNAGQKWLPIEFHPHYRAALDQLEAAPVPPAEQSEGLPGEPSVRESLGGDGQQPSDDAGSPPDGARASVRRPLGLLAIGLVLVVGTQMALSVTPFGWLSATATATSQISALAASTAVASDSPGDPAGVVGVEKPTPTTVEASQAIAGGAVVLGPVQTARPSVARTVVETLPAAPVLPQQAADLSPDTGMDSLPPLPAHDSNQATTADSSEPSQP